VNNGRIVDAAPNTYVIPDSGGCDITTIHHSKLHVLDAYSVRFDSSYKVVCGLIPFTEVFNHVHKLR
jgi:hypothetical protein